MNMEIRIGIYDCGGGKFFENIPLNYWAFYSLRPSIFSLNLQ
jgi:hypothetical protein